VKFIGQKIKYMGEVHSQTTTQLTMSPKLSIVTMSSQTTKKSCHCPQMKKNTSNKIKTDTKNQEKKKKNNRGGRL
jgi:hypothetical protein